MTTPTPKPTHTPAIYLGGAVDRLADLGITWRREAATALIRGGFRPVWPELLESGFLVEGHNNFQDIREAFAREPRHYWIDNCRRLLLSSAALFRLSPAAGPGTLAELHLACAAGMPVVCYWPNLATLAEVETCSAVAEERAWTRWSGRAAACGLDLDNIDLDDAITLLRELLGVGKEATT